MREIKLMVFCFILALSLPVMGKQDGLKEQKNSETTISLIKEKNIRLEEQNKILISSSSELRTSYYWSLGFAATFLLLFLGVNIYFFRNRYNEDKEYLLNHIDLKLNEGAIQTREEITNQFIELEKKLGDMAVEKVKQSISSMNSRINSIHEHTQENTIAILDLEVEHLIRYGCDANLITGYFRLAQEIKKLKSPHWDWKMSGCLENIGKLLEKNIEFDSGELPDVSSFLNGLPEQFDDAVFKIKNRLRSAG